MIRRLPWLDVPWLSNVFASILADSIHELDAGPHQGQQVSAIEAPSALLGHVEQPEGHQQPLGPGARARGRPLAQPHGDERRLDHVGGAQVLPLFRVTPIRVDGEELLSNVVDRRVREDRPPEVIQPSETEPREAA
jgi:hypothetical protein